MNAVVARTTRSLAALALALFSIGCGPEVPPAVASTTATQFGTAAAIETAKLAAFRSVRIYTAYSGYEPTFYKEEFVKDVHGRTRVNLLELNGYPRSALSGEALQAFDTLAALLLGGGGHYVDNGRDFAIRNLDRFLQNYTFQLATNTEVVAGRTCLVATIVPNITDRPRYTVWVDAERFTTLRYVEQLATGAVSSQLDTLEVDYSFDASNVTFLNPPVTPPVDVTSSNWTGLVDFEGFLPTYLPEGFVEDGIGLATIATRRVVTWQASDGIQQIYLAQYKEMGTPEMEPPVGYPANAPLHVRSTLEGAIVNSKFVIHGTQLHLKSKIEYAEVETVLQSLNPVGP